MDQTSKKEDKFSTNKEQTSTIRKILVTAKDLITPRTERVVVKAQVPPTYTADKKSRSRSRSAEKERIAVKTFIKYPQDDAPSAV